MVRAAAKPKPRTAARLWGVQDVATYLDVPVGWVYRRTGPGAPDALPCVKLGGFLRFRPAEIEQWIEARRIEQANGVPVL